jgi:Flp pilus assembly protein TadD
MYRLETMLRGLLAVCLFAGCSALTNYHAKGLRLLETGRRAEAWEAFEKGYHQDPHSPFSLNNMGYVLEMRDERLFEAADFYRRAIAACETREGEAEMARLEKKARENLARVLWKMQNAPRWHVTVPDPRIPGRKS